MNNLFEVIIKESESWGSLEMIEQSCMAGEGGSLARAPMQPLYMVVKNLPPTVTAELLPRITKEQRQTMIDLDLWHRDEIDVESFEYWIQTYAACPNQTIKREFVKSEEFLLYIKGRFVIHTFDVEDPAYPEHDNYFLTDDNLLLIEFDEEFSSVNEVQGLIRELYAELGVEKAYAQLFKMMVDSFLSMQEEVYHYKKLRLQDFGMVDYYEALEYDNSLPSIELLENFIRKKTSATPELDEISSQQTLHQSGLVQFRQGIDDINSELLKISDFKRQNLLKFSFIKAMNVNIALNDVMKDGALAFSKVGNNVKNKLLLGISYLRENNPRFHPEDQGILVRFDFLDLIKIANTLIRINQKKLKKTLENTPFHDQTEAFLGSFWSEFLDNSFDETVTFRSVGEEKATAIITADRYRQWCHRTETLISMLPYITSFFKTFSELKESDRISDEYYLNYSLIEIDFEALILSTLFNFAIGKLNSDSTPKLGLTVDELKTGINIFFDNEIKYQRGAKQQQILDRFISSFGLDKVAGIDDYLSAILQEQMEGLDYHNLSWEDFKHVGGPILFKALCH